MKLFIVRHGETELNFKGLIQGSMDSALSEKGLRQVSALAERLKNIHFDQIFASDLGRAQATAMAIAAYHPAPIVSSELIRERNFGKLEGGAWSMLGVLTQQLRLQPHEFVPPDGESFDVLRARARVFIDRHLPMDSEDTVLVVAHGGTNRCLLAELLEFNNRFMCNMKQGNCCINYLDITNAGLTEAILNDTSHLPVE